MQLLKNPFRSMNRTLDLPAEIPFPSTNVSVAVDLMTKCPVAKATPLIASGDLAAIAQVASVQVKDERNRMGLGSFKALGAAYVIARDAAKRGGDNLQNALSGKVYVTASAGNHGISVAAGAKVFGAQAVIYISSTVPESFAVRLREKGAQVVREGADYEASMAAALAAAKSNDWQLLSDSSWGGYTEMPHRLMEGYLILMDEVFSQISEVPTHIFLQAGVGGMASAIAALARFQWENKPTIVAIEPEFAPALHQSIKAGKVETTDGPVSCMGRLDCKTPSLIALKGLARDADFFAIISEDQAVEYLPELERAGFSTTPSGGAGLAGLLASGPHRDALGLTRDSRVLAILSEGPET